MPTRLSVRVRHDRLKYPIAYGGLVSNLLPKLFPGKSKPNVGILMYRNTEEMELVPRGTSTCTMWYISVQQTQQRNKTPPIHVATIDINEYLC